MIRGKEKRTVRLEREKIALADYTQCKILMKTLRWNARIAEIYPLTQTSCRVQIDAVITLTQCQCVSNYTYYYCEPALKSHKKKFRRDLA